MQRVHLNGVDLEYDVQGSGEPLVLIHGSILADAFVPLLADPRIASHYRVIWYHRRGFAGSSRASHPFTIAEQAADGRVLLRYLGVARAHLAGHSYGAAIAWSISHTRFRGRGRGAAEKHIGADIIVELAVRRPNRYQANAKALLIQAKKNWTERP